MKNLNISPISPTLKLAIAGRCAHLDGTVHPGDFYNYLVRNSCGSSPKVKELCTWDDCLGNSDIISLLKNIDTDLPLIVIDMGKDTPAKYQSHMRCMGSDLRLFNCTEADLIEALNDRGSIKR